MRYVGSQFLFAIGGIGSGTVITWMKKLSRDKDKPSSSGVLWKKRGEGINMSKQYYEVAAEIVQEIIKARGQAIAGSGSAAALTRELLSDEAIATTYKAILNAVEQGN